MRGTRDRVAGVTEQVSPDRREPPSPRISANELAAALKCHGWTTDIGGTTICLHRKSLCRVSFDLEWWPEGIDALLRAAVEIARVDAAMRKRADPGPSGGSGMRNGHAHDFPSGRP